MIFILPVVPCICFTVKCYRKAKWEPNLKKKLILAENCEKKNAKKIIKPLIQNFLVKKEKRKSSILTEKQTNQDKIFHIKYMIYLQNYFITAVDTSNHINTIQFNLITID